MPHRRRPLFSSYCSSVVVLLTRLVPAQASKRAHSFKDSGKSLLDAESYGEIVWRIARLCVAFSPLFAIIYCVCCTRDSSEIEEERRNKKDADFVIGKKGGMKKQM
mmetsp:Transcript_74357/g.206431  ORF Transcript_74357/g.206431 Transcript_74357/m.206431 type:complete len:106 (-) Transcript_74357:196-513(-)